MKVIVIEMEMRKNELSVSINDDFNLFRAHTDASPIIRFGWSSLINFKAILTYSYGPNLISSNRCAARNSLLDSSGWNAEFIIIC